MMEENKSKIGEAFNQAFKNFKIEPEPEVWVNISNKIAPAKGGFTFGKYLFIGLIALIIGGAGSLILFNNGERKIENQKLIAKNNSEPIKILKTDTSTFVDNNKSNKNFKTETQKIKTNKSLTNLMPCGDKVEGKNVDEIERFNNKTGKELIVNTEKSVAKNNISNQNLPKIEKIQPKIEKNFPIVDIESPKKQAVSKITFSNDPTICFGEDAKLQVNGGRSYSWSNSNNSSEILVQPVANSIYTVTVTDEEGSIIVHDFKITIDKECTAVFVPSAFSPNGDGNNDVFKALGENILEFEMQIMNRQGQIVFRSKDINFGWNGIVNGSMAQSEVYVYSIVYKNGRGEQSIKKGQFTLVR